jgi:hypothetical protein
MPIYLERRQTRGLPVMNPRDYRLVGVHEEIQVHAGWNVYKYITSSTTLLPPILANEDATPHG